MTICLVSGLRTPGRDALEDDVRRVQRKRTGSGHQHARQHRARHSAVNRIQNYIRRRSQPNSRPSDTLILSDAD